MRRFYFFCKRIESGMPKNAIESADYYSDSRKRRHYLILHYEEGTPDLEAAATPRLWTFFIMSDSIGAFLRHARSQEVKVAD